MKIAFDHQTFTIHRYGGVSRYYTTLAKELITKGQEIEIFAGIYRNRYLQSLPKKYVNGIKVKDYIPKTAPLVNAINYRFGQRAIHDWKPDILHETYYSSHPIQTKSARRVATVHDMIHEKFSNEFSQYDTTTERKKNTFDRADHIISVSHSTKQDLINIFGVDESKITVVHLGVDVETFYPRTESIIVEPYILYVGSRHNYKNFFGLLKACSLSKQLKNKLKILTFGGGKFTRNEKAVISDLGFNEGSVVQINGTDDVLAKLYSAATCFVYPSLYEGFGLPPLEAMACGCPVLSSNTSSMPEVTNSACEYFDPKSCEEMCCAIENIVLSETRRIQLRSLGFKNVKQFTWEGCAQNTLKVYAELCNQDILDVS